jgi:hypothetical protein
MAGETQAYSLTVDADNTHVLDDVGWPQTAGSERPLLDLTITGKTTLAGTSTNTVNTVNGQTYAGSVLLAADQELSGESMWFQSAVDGTFALTVNGTTTFDGFVGASPALKSLQANGHVQMNGGGVTTTTYQTYAGSVTLGNGAVLTGSDVTFEDKVDAGSDGGQGLIVDVTSRATINDLVGDDQRLLDLWVKGTGSAHINGGFIDTTTTQLYDVPVTLGSSAELVGSTITFNKTVDGASSGAQALEIVGNTGGEGNAEFNAPVGSDVALEHVHVEGTTKMNAGTVDTTGDQDYDGAVTLWKDTTLTLSDPPSVASFHSTVDGLNDGTQLLLINGNAFFGDSAGAGSTRGSSR